MIKELPIIQAVVLMVALNVSRNISNLLEIRYKLQRRRRL